MNIHCTYCRHSFNLTLEFMAQAVAEAAEKNHKSYSMDCPSCRKTIKVSVKQMRRFVPRQAEKED
jgi:nitrate/TMAO reductase-like tetraheme cytochrome c subunit